MPSVISQGAILHYALQNGGTQILTPLIPVRDPNGFDTATMRIDFRGDATGIENTYKIGNGAPNHASMYLTGIAIEEVRFRWTTATLTYKGFWGGSAPPILVSYETGTREILYPFVSSGSTITIWKDGGNPTAAIPKFNPKNGNAPFRVRSIVPTVYLSRTGVEIGTAGAAETPPAAPGIGRPNIPGYPQPPRNQPDPLYTDPDGWVRRSYVTPPPEIYGNAVLRTWQDRWEWIDTEIF